MKPNIILLIGGKRKSGKDFLCEKLQSLIGDNCTIIRISEPLKALYAEKHSLNLAELLSNGPYKEKYRLDMINWSDEVRAKEPGYFCQAACNKALLKPIWIVSDIRRKTDIKWFRDTYSDKIKTIKIVADIEVRQQRGFIFTHGVDDVSSECDLDDFTEWDLKISNNSSEEFEEAFTSLLVAIKEWS